MARWVQRRYQFQTDGLRLLLAFLPSSLNAVEAFNASPLQKFMVRNMRSIDRIARGAEIKLAKNGSVVLVEGEKGEKEDEEGEGGGGGEGGGASAATAKLEDKFLPTVENPAFDLTYGQMLMVSRSYGSAISESPCLTCAPLGTD